MKKTILLWIFVMVLSVSLAQGVLTDDIRGYFAHEDASGNLTNELPYGDLNATVGTPVYSQGGIIDDSVNYTGNTRFVDLSGLGVLGVGGFTVNLWVKTNSQADGWIISGNQVDNSFYNIYLSGGGITYGSCDGTFTQPNFGVDIRDGNWHMLTMTYEWLSSDCTVYYNGGYKANGIVNPAGNSNFTSGNHVLLGQRKIVGSEPWYGYIDEFGIWNRTLSATEILEIYSQGIGGIGYPFLNVTPTPDTLNISGESYPANNTQYNYNPIIFNTTVNSTFDFNCSLWINGTINETEAMCYQETANISTTCGGLSSGSYDDCSGQWHSSSCVNTSDGDWDTRGYAQVGFSVNRYINYSKPLNITNSSFWRVKLGGGEENFSLPSGCWSQSELELRVLLRTGICAPDCSDLYCYNGTSWYELDDSSIDGGSLYEEAVDWNISDTVHGYSSGTDVPVVFSLDMPDGDWTFNITCWNTNGSIENTTQHLFYIDTTNPTTSTNFTGGFIEIGKNYSYQFNFSDENYIWGYNITLNGFLINYTFNLESSDISYILTNDSWVIGQNNITTWFADTHTKKEVKDMKLSKVGDKLKIDNTFLTSKTSVDKITYIKNTDRYNFCFYYKKPMEEVVLYLPDDCYYQSKSDYLGHFVCKNDLQWWDFENKDDYEISVDKDKNEIVVRSDVETDRFCFNSVGSLNTVERNYSVWGYNLTTEYYPSGFEGGAATFKLIFDSTNTSYFTQSNLFFNNTYYTPTETNGTAQRNFTVDLTLPSVSIDTIKTWYFNYTFDSVEYNTTLTNFTIYNVDVTNCSDSSHYRAINFTFYNATGGVDSLINGTMDGHITTDFYGEFNLSWGSESSVGVCIYPNTTSTVSELQFQYEIQGCGTRTYYLDTTLDNTTQHINLYCDAETSPVTFNVKDQDDDDVPNVFIYVQKYDIGTATATTVEIIKTDSDGQAIGNIVKDTQLYKFVLIYGGNIVLETTETYILLDEYTFRIGEGEDYFDDYDRIFNTFCDIWYTNATTSFSYSWVDPSNNVTEACLDIYMMSNTGTILMNNSCTLAASGTIALTIPSPVGTNTYMATGYIYIDDEKFVCTNSESVSFDLGWQDYATEGLFLSFLLLIFLITLGLWHPVVAIALMIIGVVLLNILGLFHLSWGWMLGFIILGGIVIYKMRQT